VFEAKQTAVETYFKSNWNTTQIHWENTAGFNPEIYEEFVRFTLGFGDSTRMQIGGGGYRYFGVLMIQVFVKEGIGVNRGVKLADIVSGLFRDQIVSGVNFAVPFVTKFPKAEKGWFQVQVSTPFYFDEVTP
jgi:hypothetical protein